MDYLYFALVTLVILVIVCALVLRERAKETPNPRLRQKPKGPGIAKRSSGQEPQEPPKKLKGGRYIPSYQGNPEAVKHIERFLCGFANSHDNPTAEKQDPAGERSPDSQGPVPPANENDEINVIEK